MKSSYRLRLYPAFIGLSGILLNYYMTGQVYSFHEQVEHGEEKGEDFVDSFALTPELERG